MSSELRPREGGGSEQGMVMVKFGAMRVVINKDLDESVLAAIKAICGDIKKYCQQARVIAKRKDTVYHLKHAGLDLCIKQFAPVNLLRSTGYRRVGSAAQRSFDYGCYLRQHGISSALTMAHIEEWRGGRLVASYLISEYLTDLENMWQYLEQGKDLTPIAQAIRAMHDTGFVHLDLGNQNILLPKQNEITSDQVQFIDLNRGKICQPITEAWRAKGLSRIIIRDLELNQYFLQAYSQGDLGAGFINEVIKLQKKFQRFSNSHQLRHPIETLVKKLTNP